MNTRFGRIVIAWALVLVTVWLGDRLYRSYVYVADEPKLVVPEGKLSDWEKSNIELFHAAGASVTYITTEQVRFNPFRGAIVAQGAGSGFIWDEAGHVVTNFHVIEGATTVYVQLHAGDAMRAGVIGGAPEYNIAVVRLHNPPHDLQPLPIGTSKSLSVGQATFAIGNPFGLSRTLTTGVVTAVERHLPTAQGREIRGVIQTDAAINPGNSGGPLLDSTGRLIGMNTAIISESGSSAGIGFAIPVDLINRVVPQIITQGRAPLPGIGITPADESVAAQLGVRGVVVLGVRQGSPADQAGIRAFDPRFGAGGDIIVAAGGQRTQTAADLAAVFEDAGVGKEVTLKIVRGDTEREVKVRVIDLGT
jgi:2-alkenal reductase